MRTSPGFWGTKGSTFPVSVLWSWISAIGNEFSLWAIGEANEISTGLYPRGLTRGNAEASEALAVVSGLLEGGRVPEWEERGYTPVVFVRVANKGVRAYVKQKSVEVLENKER